MCFKRMDLKLKGILAKIESQGFECFLVGGYVRDYILGIKSYDIDITTNATPDKIKKILGLSTEENYGCISFKRNKYTYEITTYRRELSYYKRHPKFVFIDDIYEDLKRRDFTINAICMDFKGHILDPLNGKVDLEKRILRAIGNVDAKLKEDPLRILRAIRFTAIYNLTIEENLENFIKNNPHLVRNISKEKIISELNKIFKSSASTKGVELLNKYNILKHLGLKLSRDFIASSICSSWAQFEFISNYPFPKNIKARIKQIQEILLKGKIEKEDLFNYDLDICLEASKILPLKRSEVIKMYKDLPIKNAREIKITGQEMANLINSPKMIKDVKKQLINEIICGNLANEKDAILKFIIEKWK